jgi:hypothetical protein
MALSSYRKSFLELPFSNLREASVFDKKGPTEFRCSYDEFVASLQKDEILFGLLLVSHVSLVEEFGRAIVQQLITRSAVPPSSFPGLQTSQGNLDEAVEQYILRCNVEAWGRAILASCDRDWSVVPGGEADLVHAFVVRNIVAHGRTTYNQIAINRLSNVSPTNCGAKVGDRARLDRDAFQNHLTRLRNFSRVIAGAPSRTLRMNSGSP